METTKGAGFESLAIPSLPQGKRVFFGIGIDAYRSKTWPRLNNAVRDVEHVAHLLRVQYDFDEVVLLKDGTCTAENIQQQLYQFTDPSVLGEHDSLLIYYSGHGHLDRNQRGYWVPVDADADRIATYVPNTIVRDRIADMRCRHVLLVSDACFSGSLFVRGMRGVMDVPEEYERRASRWAFCSGRHDQQVYDGKPGEHSPFAAALLQELALNNTRKTNIARLADSVIAITAANYKGQTPEANPMQDVGHKGGQFVFTPNGRTALPVQSPAVSVPPLPPPVGGSPRQWAVLGGVLFALLATVLVLFWQGPETTVLNPSPAARSESPPAILPMDTPATVQPEVRNVPVATKRAKLRLSRTSIQLGTINLGATIPVQFEIENTGEAVANQVALTYDTRTLRLIEGNTTFSIRPQERRTIRLEWTPQTPGNQTFEIEIQAGNVARAERVRGEVLVRELLAVHPEKMDTIELDLSLRTMNIWIVLQGRKIKPKDIEGTLFFIGKNLKGKTIKVYFGSDACYDEFRIGQDAIISPDCSQ